MTEIKYRPDIDGLRAVAVMLVVLHHLSSKWMPGGYLGVDVFFVISGFLITKVISREIEEGRFTFAQFYERRVRRLFPALFVVLFFVLAAGYFLLLPSDYLAMFRATLGTVFFASNMVFWRDLADGYFATNAGLNPLLHTWTLAVEEQFYLLYPLLLLVCFRYAKQHVVLALFVLSAMSLVAAEFLLHEHRVAVFFLSPFRAWELLTGAMIAFKAAPVLRSRHWREVAAAVGLLAIVIPAFLYDVNTAFPALAAVPPVLGSALLIHAGSSGSSLAGRVLQWRPVVYVGLISYSLYLWHWPLLVFAKYWIDPASLGPWLPVLLLASLLISSGSYHFIERPFRKARNGVSRRALLALGFAVVVPTTACALVGVLNRGLEGRFSDKVVALDRVRAAPVPFKACGPDSGRHDGYCVVGDISQQPDVLLWGDSHMLAWMPGFDAAFQQSGRSALVAWNSNCPPLLGVLDSVDDACQQQNMAVLFELRRSDRIRTVVMSAFWSKYFSDSEISLSTMDGKDGNRSVAPAAFRQTIASLIQLGSRVVVLGPVPSYSRDVPLSLAQQDMTGRALVEPQVLQDVHRQNANFYRVIGTGLPHQIEFFDVAAWLCRPRCETYRDGISIYRDSNHLSPGGAKMLVPNIIQMFATPSLPAGNRIGVAIRHASEVLE
jgi:peptidoglycan/LPS O-acetylase OafA/YrhL